MEFFSDAARAQVDLAERAGYSREEVMRRSFRKAITFQRPITATTIQRTMDEIHASKLRQARERVSSNDATDSAPIGA